MSRTKQKRLTAYFLLLLMLAAPTLTEAATPEDPAVPNSIGAYIYVDDDSEVTTFDGVNKISDWTNTDRGVIVNDSNTKNVVVNSSAASQTFSNNSSATNGGVIYNKGTVTLGDSITFSKNSANAPYYGGGAIYSTEQGTVILGTNAHFNNNRIDSDSYSAGGAIAGWGGSTVRLGYGAEFVSNGVDPSAKSSYAFGGAVYMDTDWIKQAVFNAGDGATFTSNKAGYGGAMYLGSTDADFSQNAKFYSNSAINGSGGAIYAFGGHAPSWAPAGYEGNLVANDVNFNGHVTFDKNTAKTYGGAIFNYAQSSITGGGSIQSLFSGNEAGADGGAIYNSGYNGYIDDYGTATETDTASIVLNNVLFDTNKAQGSGGAIYNTADDGLGDLSASELAALGTVTISKGEFKNNTAVNGNGGAIYNEATVTINGDSKFTENKAGGLGGAIYNAGSLNLDTTAGNIVFSDNTANGKANDIYLEAGSVMNVTGSNKVIVKNGLISKIFDPSASGISLFSAKSSVVTSDINVASGATLVLGDEDAEYTSDDGSFDLEGNVNVTGTLVNEAKTTISGTASTTGSGNIVNNNELTVSGSLGGKVTQQDKDAVINVTNTGSIIASAADEIIGGTLNIASGGNVTGTLSVSEAVKLEIEGASVLDSVGLQVGSGHIVNNTGLGMNLTGSSYTVYGGTLGTSAIVSNASVNNSTATDDITVGSGATLTLSNAATSNKGFISNGTSKLKLAPTKNGVLNLTANNVISGDGNVIVDQIVETKYDWKEETNSYDTIVEKKGVGTVNISADNSGFVGSFVQKMGNVVQKAGKFFGGTNSIEGGTVTIRKGAELAAKSTTVSNGTLNLQDGAIVKTGTAAVPNVLQITTGTDDNGNATHGTLNLYNKLASNPSATPLLDEEGNEVFKATILASDISTDSNTALTYLNNDGTATTDPTTQAIGISGGVGLGLFNGTMIEGLDTNADGLTELSLASDSGVRYLTLGNGAGIYADDINLGADTKLTYKDNAYIRDDSNVSLGARAELTFANNSTDVSYTSVISSEDNTAKINKEGAGKTEITSSLANYKGSVNVTAGSLDLQNEEAASLNKVTVKNAELNLSSDVTAVNLDVNNSKLTANKNLSATNVSLKNAVTNIAEDFNAVGTVKIDNTKLSILGKANLGATTVSGDNTVINLSQGAILNSLSIVDNGLLISPADITVNGALVLGNALGTDNPTIDLTSGGINTITAGPVTLNTDTNILIDADPRSKAIDSIKSSAVTANNGAQMVITGMNFTETPIDRNVTIDISKLLDDGTGSGVSLVRMGTGSIIAETEMGKYLLSASSTGSSNTVKATLVQLNPQMFRGQVATVAGYANQLVVNNLLLDHTNILANDLIARDKKANLFAAANPIFAPYQYSKKDGDLWYKSYVNFERLTMTQGLHVKNNSYGAVVGGDFPLIELSNGWNIVPTGYIAYNGGHQHFHGVSMYQDGAQLGAMATAYKGDFITSLLAYGGGYHNHMTVHGPIGSGSDDTGNWFAGVASKTAYNIHLPADFILQPTGLVSYNIFGNQNYHSDFGNMSMNAGYLNGINVAPGVNLIWNKKTFSLYGTAQLVFNIMGDVSGKAGNVDLDDTRMKTTYFEYGLGAMKKFRDTFNAYLQFTIRNGYRTGIGFQGGLQWKVGKKADKTEK